MYLVINIEQQDEARFAYLKKAWFFLVGIKFSEHLYF